METKDKNVLVNELKRNYDEIIHNLIHDLHAESERLLDDDPNNDIDAILQIRPTIDELLHVFGLRWQLSKLKPGKNGDSIPF